VLIAVWGPGRVGIKISPAAAQGGFRPTSETPRTYDHLVRELDRRPLSHLQVVRAPGDVNAMGYWRERFHGPLIANLGYDKASATALIESGGADLVSFAKPFIGNPDLVRRLEEDLPLAEGRVETFYQGGPQGYVDYAPAP